MRLGLECDVAQDGLAALTAINHHHYDLVLMDCQMPRMDGYEPPGRFACGRPPRD